MNTPRRRRGRLPWGVAVVRGDSMNPTYVEGDRLLVHYGSAYRLGDVVVASLPDGPMGARPIGVKRLARWVEGAAWLASDNPAGTDSATFGAVDPAAILGKVVWRIPKQGRAKP